MNELGERIIEFTDLCFKEHERVKKEEGITFLDENARFFFLLTQKIINNFSTTGTLIKLSKQEGQKYFIDSAYILLRSGLSDIIIAFWLYDPTIKDNDEYIRILTKRINELKKDHVRFHLDQLKYMETLGLVSDEEKKDELDVVNTQYKHFLDKELLDFNHNIKEGTPIKRMLNNSNKNNPALVAAYRCYYILSKIEHTGEFTEMMLSKPETMEQYYLHAIFAIENAIKVFMKRFFTDEEFGKNIYSYKVVKWPSPK